jgi:Putative lumazine-binding
MTDQPDIAALMRAVERYFDLMHEADVSIFDRVFQPTAQLHGLRDGAIRVLTAEAYRKILASTPSPRSLGAPREDALLLLDVTSCDQALAKVRVRINAIVYVDYLSYHHVDGDWFVTSKAFHVESQT